VEREPFERRHRVAATIPTVSMGDIAFLLLIFFMATTILRTERGVEVRLPTAEATETHENKHLLHVWIDPAGRLFVDDRPLAVEGLAAVLAREVAAEPALVVAFNADVRAPYRAVDGVLEELRKANVVHVSFTSEPHPDAAGK
jgi:biopolymer transport protein ExbD